jgi:hypothetical protein
MPASALTVVPSRVMSPITYSSGMVICGGKVEMRRMLEPREKRMMVRELRVESAGCVYL